MSGVRKTIFVAVSMESLDGVEPTREAAHAALALHVQGQPVTHQASGGQWLVKTAILYPGEEMIGRRAVCAEEGHRIPEKPRDSTFGCQRCDLVFRGL